MSTTPETAASLHGRRAALDTKLRDALLAGSATTKLREDLATVDRQLAELAHREAVASEERHAEAARRIETAAQATTDSIRQRLALVLEDLEPPQPEICTVDDGSIQQAAEDLEHANAALVEADRVLADAQGKADALADRIAALETRRSAIIARRSAGETHAGDGAEVALIQVDLEGLASMRPALTEPVVSARQVVNNCAAARQRAAKGLSTAEDRALAAALHQRLDELAGLMAAALAKDDAQILRRGTHRPEWVPSFDLLEALKLRAGKRPDVHLAGRPGSKWPARPLVDA